MQAVFPDSPCIRESDFCINFSVKPSSLLASRVVFLCKYQLSYREYTRADFLELFYGIVIVDVSYADVYNESGTGTFKKHEGKPASCGFRLQFHLLYVC